MKFVLVKGLQIFSWNHNQIENYLGHHNNLATISIFILGCVLDITDRVRYTWTVGYGEKQERIRTIDAVIIRSCINH